MQQCFAKKLGDVDRSLSRCISALEAAGLQVTASLIRMSRLDLQMRLNEISEEELASFCQEVERQAFDSPEAAALAAQ